MSAGPPPGTGMHYREDGTPKRAFQWLDEARQASATHFERGELVMPYRCLACGFWHVGHVERRHRRRAAARATK